MIPSEYVLIADVPSWIGALTGLAGGLFVAGTAAWVALRKGNAEVNKGKRNGVIEEWREIADRCEKRCDEREQEVKALHSDAGKREIEIEALRKEVDTLKLELSALRIQISARSTEAVEARGDIRALEKAALEASVMKAEELAGIAGGGEPPAQTPKPVKVEIVPTKGQDPLPVLTVKNKPQ